MSSLDESDLKSLESKLSPNVLAVARFLWSAEKFLLGSEFFFQHQRQGAEIASHLTSQSHIKQLDLTSAMLDLQTNEAMALFQELNIIL